MKNVFKVLGIIALVAVIGFLVAACGDGSDDSGGGSAFLGDTLNLSGQVYKMKYNPNGTTTYTEYKDYLTLSDDNGGSATITGGKLSYSIETPNNLETFDNYYFYDYDNVTISDTSAKYFSLDFYIRDDDTGTYYDLFKGNIAVNIGNTSGTQTYENVNYWYVDKDVTISGKGKTETGTEDGYTYTYKTNNFSLALKKGWNAVYQKTVFSYTATSSTGTRTVSLKNPSLKWLLYEYDVGGGGK